MNSEDRRLILIITGSVDLHLFAREVLSATFQIMEGNSAERGLALAKQMNPDLVICDISNPAFGGVSICARLRSESVTSRLSIILLGPDNLEIEGLLAGADDYILYPFDKVVLALRIEKLIRRRELFHGQNAEQRSDQQKSDDSGGKFLLKLRQLILENIADSGFGVHEMAFHIGISVSVLYRKLRFFAGITVNEFVKTIRMKRAMQLLETGEYSVNEVATAVGYEDSKYFSREFRKTFGKTPTEVKGRSVRGNEDLV